MDTYDNPDYLTEALAELERVRHDPGSTPAEIAAAEADVLAAEQAAYADGSI